MLYPVARSKTFFLQRNNDIKNKIFYPTLEAIRTNMHQNTSCLLALVLAASSALVAMPSQAQTAETNADITAFSQSSITNESTISRLKKSKAVNQNEVINISQSLPEDSSTANTQKTVRERIPVYSRIFFGLKQ